MANGLPPPIALRGFEAAARHMSFTRAAHELGVTQAAVSHQVKALEADLGVRLFHRLTRRLVLTDEGQVLYGVVGDAFSRIAATAEQLREATAGGSLTVSLGSYVSVAWLSPRIGRFWRRYPNIDLRLHHTMEPADARQWTVDIAVDWGRGPDNWPGLVAELLLDVRATPVCSPRLLDGPRPLRRPADLGHHTLLHEAGRGGWPQWLAAAGVTDIDARAGPEFDDHNVVVHAAMEGQGVALAEASFIAEDVAAGRLARPFALTIDFPDAYYVVYPPGALDRPKVKAFRDWLMEEAAAFRGRATSSGQ